MTHRIVIAEDEPDIRSNLTRLLQLEQYEVWAAPNGAEALELVRQHLPDLVLSDVMMPRMSGHELIHAMRGDTLLAHIPAILLTARAEHSDVREGMNLGADDYLVKPFKRDELLAAVRGRLERAASQQAVHRRLQDEARRLLHFDAPTNLPNRALLLERCALALLPTADAPSVVVAMVVIALDGLGQINQALGHAGGDEVLCQTADPTCGCHSGWRLQPGGPNGRQAVRPRVGSGARPGGTADLAAAAVWRCGCALQHAGARCLCGSPGRCGAEWSGYFSARPAAPGRSGLGPDPRGGR
jgi:CheY-like chemotaxis protein